MVTSDSISRFLLERMYAAVEEVDNDCRKFNGTQLLSLIIIRGSTAVFCVVVIVSMLVVLCIIKAYKSFIQRLFLYLLIATVLLLLCHVCTFERLLFDDNVHADLKKKICFAMGFITNWMDNTVHLIHLSLIISTLTLAFLSMKSMNLTITTRQKVFLEGLYLILIITLPITFMWIPLLNRSYGITVAWCWIKVYDDDDVNCNSTIKNTIYQLVFGYGLSEITGIAGICALTVISIAYYRVAASFTHAKKLLFQSLKLTLFVLLFILSINTGFVIRIYSVIDKNWTQSYGLWLLYGAMITLWHLIIPCGFMGSFYFSHIKNICWKKYKRRIQYERLDDRNTVPASERVTAPSNTFFSVPFTNEFNTT